jgi:hypothetical protein
MEIPKIGFTDVNKELLSFFHQRTGWSKTNFYMKLKEIEAGQIRYICWKYNKYWLGKNPPLVGFYHTNEELLQTIKNK